MEEGLGLGGAKEMSNSMGSEEEEEETEQRSVRMGKKRGERGNALILRNDAANDIGDDAATDAIFADGSESERETVCWVFPRGVWVYPMNSDIVLFFWGFF